MDVTLSYDMRAPAFGTPAVDLYQAAVAQCAWADTQGFASVAVTEHHASDDGYLPSPIVLGSALAAATGRMLIRLSVVLLPLYDPLRAAEDLAVLDLISNGRLRLTVGAGYRPVEYEQFGLDIRNRPSRMEEAIEVLKLAWTGEPFEYLGQQVQILPRPAQDPRPEITLGGASPATARRAAAMCDDYAPIGDRLYEIYLEELDRLGKPHPKRKRVPMDGGPVFVHVSEDPDAAWAQIAPHALHESNGYAIWIAGARGGAYNMATDANELRESGQYQVLTPAEAVELAKTRGLLNLKPVMGGMDPELGWECLQLVADQVLPALEESAQ